MEIALGLTTTELALALGVLALGAFVQGATGFGFGLVSVPLLIWIGLPVPVAVTLVLTGTLTHTASGCWRHRREIVWADAWPVMALRTAAMPLGLAVMFWMAGQGLGVVKQVVGVVLLVAVGLIVVARPKPRAKIRPGWTAAAGLVSGTMSGMIAMGGPPVVMWVMAHGWSAHRSRVFLWLMFLQLMPLQLAVMGGRFGGAVWWAIAAGVVATPVLVLAGAWGARAGANWSRQKLRAVTLVMLVAIAVVSIIGPWLG